jgi:hypothetical protein
VECEELKALRETVAQIARDYKKRRYKGVTGDAKYLELKRLKSFPEACQRVRSLELLRLFETRRGGAGRTQDTAATLVTAVFHEFLMQKAAVSVDEQGVRQWVLSEDLDGLDEVLYEFAQFLETGWMPIRIGFPARERPFLVHRGGPRTWPPTVKLVDGVHEACDGTIFAESLPGQDDPGDAHLALARLLQYVILAGILSLSGHVRQVPPRPLRARCWEPYRLQGTIQLEPFLRLEREKDRTWWVTGWSLISTRPAALDIDKDLPTFREAHHLLVKNLDSISNPNRRRFEAALRRLVAASERHVDEDRLVDYVIVLETLLGEGRDELRFRISLLTTELLGGPPDCRETVFAYVRKAYDLRSDIVHGGAGGDQVSETAERCGFICRAALRKFLELGAQCDDVPRTLHRRLICSKENVGSVI